MKTKMRSQRKNTRTAACTLRFADGVFPLFCRFRTFFLYGIPAMRGREKDRFRAGALIHPHSLPDRPSTSWTLVGIPL